MPYRHGRFIDLDSHLTEKQNFLVKLFSKKPRDRVIQHAVSGHGGYGRSLSVVHTRIMTAFIY
ncbi:hypothetical protein S101446_01638 [Komagataeibacter europaeus]|nr:hypothetical protein S101446_01638 [Komagataeibacter europaeus]